MKKIIKSLAVVLFLSIFSCSDGTQVVNQVNKLIKENKVEKVVVDFNGKKKEYTIPKKGKKLNIILDNQFIQLDGDIINLGQLRSLRVTGKILEINL